MERMYPQKSGDPKIASSSEAQDEIPSVSKRTLLRSAWIAPVIVVLNLPRSGYAANMSGTSKRGRSGHDGDNNNNPSRNGRYKHRDDSERLAKWK